MQVRDRHVAVTGASSGIGAAIAAEMAAHGARVTLVARREERLRELATTLARDHGTESFVAVADLARLETSTDWIEEARAALGPIDVLVNNAGVQVIAATARVDPDEGERSVALNLLAPLRATRVVLPGMLERGDGVIVNVTSMAALAPTPRMTYYNAGKAGLAGASEALRGELRKTGVDVVTVYPGIIAETEMAQDGLAAYASSTMLALQPRGTARSLAGHVRRAVERRRARVVYPRANGLARTFPTFTRWLMDRFTPDLASDGLARAVS